jgi:hypothetical protein
VRLPEAYGEQLCGGTTGYDHSATRRVCAMRTLDARLAEAFD